MKFLTDPLIIPVRECKGEFDFGLVYFKYRTSSGKDLSFGGTCLFEKQIKNKCITHDPFEYECNIIPKASFSLPGDDFTIRLDFRRNIAYIRTAN